MIKNKSSKKKILIVLVITVIICIGVSDFIYSNPQIKFVVNDYISAYKTSVELKEISPEVNSTDLQDILNDEKTTFNQSLMLINTENKMKDDFSADIVYYGNSEVQMNSCMADAYRLISEEISEKFGEKLYISDAYRTSDEQTVLEESNKYATEEGASEHQAGLALDVYVKFYSGKAFLKSEVGRYVNENCWQQGFIIRYPYYGKKDTGIGYEPWHIRYVGLPHSEIIYKNRWTLEEYTDYLEDGKFYGYGDYIVTRQKGDTPKVPVSYESLVISQDNQDGYIYTFKIN